MRIFQPFALLALASCSCPVGVDYEAHFRFELPGIDELRDVRAETCFISAKGRPATCASGPLLYGRPNPLTFSESAARAESSVSIETPDLTGDAFLLRWRWEGREGLQDGDRYTLVVRDASGGALIEAARVVDYRASEGASGCETRVVVDQELP